MSKNDSGRESGRVALVLPVLLALAVVAALYFWLIPEKDLTQTAVSPATSEDSLDEPTEVEDGSEPGRPAVPLVSLPPSNPPERIRRLVIRVVDGAGNPVVGAAIRWFPGVSTTELRGWTHDRRLLEPEYQSLGSRPAIPAASRSDSAGRVTVEVPITVVHGVVHGGLTGHESASKELLFEPVSPGQIETGELPEQHVELTLSAAGWVWGKVTDPDGQPTPGVTVLAARTTTGRPVAFVDFHRRTAGATVGEDGTYAFSGLVPGEYLLVPRPGTTDFVGLSNRKARRVEVLRGKEAGPVDFQVERGGSVSGQVFRPDGSPLPLATIRVSRVDAMSQSMSGSPADALYPSGEMWVTDAEGRYRAAGIPFEHELRVVAGSADFADTDSETFVLTIEEPTAIVDIQMWSGGTISGVVLDGKGAPVPRVLVRALPEFGALLSGDVPIERAGAGTEADDRGRFELQRLAPGKYGLTVGQQDFNPFLARDESSLIELEDGQEIRGVELTYEPGSGDGRGGDAIVGRVEDDLGNPLGGARVRALPSQMGLAGFGGTGATSEEDGSFRIPSEGTEALILRATKSGYVETQRTGVRSGQSDIVLVLDRAATLHGRVETADGTPPPSFKIQARVKKEKDLESEITDFMSALEGKNPWVQGGEDGSFVLETVPTGLVEILVTAPGFAPATSEPLDLPPGTERRGIVIRIHTGATVVGRVRRGGGSPVAEATVTLRTGGSDEIGFADLMQDMLGGGQTFPTNEDGVYEIPHLAPGTYSIQARHPEFAPSDRREFTVAVDEHRRIDDLELVPGSTLEGRVRDVAGAAIGGLMVQLLGPNGMQQGSSDALGEFRFENLSPGDYTVNLVDIAALQTGGSMRMKVRAVKIVAGENTALDVVYGTGAKISGKVEGIPPGGFRLIQLRRPGGPAPEDVDPLDMAKSIEASRYTAGVAFITTGEYLLEDVEPGVYFLEIPRMPDDPTDFQAYAEMTDRTPYYRATIEVEAEDIRHDIKVPTGE